MRLERLVNKLLAYLPEFSYTCWIAGGQQSIPLTDNEKKMTPHDLLKQIYISFIRGDYYRCTMCKQDFPNPPTSRPLFAGAVCDKCAEIHKKNLDDERKKGHVCSKCGEPYGNCCC